MNTKIKIGIKKKAIIEELTNMLLANLFVKVTRSNSCWPDTSRNPGKDKIKTSLREILESKDRNSAGITINPRGLIFLGPNYENITKLNPAKSPLIRIWK